jgi:hypothetical protein
MKEPAGMRIIFMKGAGSSTVMESGFVGVSVGEGVSVIVGVSVEVDVGVSVEVEV